MPCPILLICCLQPRLQRCIAVAFRLHQPALINAPHTVPSLLPHTRAKRSHDQRVQPSHGQQKLAFMSMSLSLARAQGSRPTSGVRCQAGLRAQAQPARAVPREQQQPPVPGKLAAGLLGAAAALSLALGSPAQAAEPFLKSTGRCRLTGAWCCSSTLHVALSIHFRDWGGVCRRSASM